LNGRVVAQGSQFSLNDVEVVTATIDIEDVRAHRAVSSRSMQAAAAERYHRIEVNFALTKGKFGDVGEEGLARLGAISAMQVKYHTPEEEIACVFLGDLVAFISYRYPADIVLVPHVGFGTI
jgi:NAD+ synthase (glutamine-hydrolysing)